MRICSYEEITAELLEALGISMLLCDLDFTLTPRWKRTPSKKLIEWINEMLDGGIQIVIVSNNHFVNRVKRYAEDKRLIKPLPYVYLAGKPCANCVRDVLSAFDVSPNEVAMIGNSNRTDMECARRAGITGWKVKPRLH